MPGRLGPASRLPVTYIVVSWPYNPLRSTALIIKAHPFGRPSSRITRLVTATSMQPSSAAFMMLVLPSRFIRARPFGWPVSMPSSFSFSVFFAFFIIGVPDAPFNLEEENGVGLIVRWISFFFILIVVFFIVGMPNMPTNLYQVDGAVHDW